MQLEQPDNIYEYGEFSLSGWKLNNGLYRLFIEGVDAIGNPTPTLVIDGKKLRDALIEAYPLPAPPEANPESFENFGKKVDAYWAGYDAGKAMSEVEVYTPAKWQEVTVDPKGAGHTYRLRVAGGWLYRTVTYRYPELHASF